MADDAGRDAVRERLDRIVREYGRNAVGDPIALRAAWRTTGEGEPSPELLAVAAHAEAITPSGRRTAALEDVVAPAAAESGLPPERLREAADLLADVLGADPARTSATADPTLPPRAPSETDGHRLVWDDAPAATELTAAAEPTAATEPTATTVTVPSTRRWSRRTVVAGGLVLALAVAAGVVTGVVVGRDEGAAGGEDRYSVTDVADRYRALGADLLAGATRCAADRAEPGEAERVRCDVDGYALTLRTYDGPQRMRDARAGLVPGGDVVRSARRTRDDGAVSVAEERNGRSTVAWDAQVPRPVAATVTGQVSLVDLAAFLDSRRYGLVPRPDVPGPMFRSGALWDLASAYVQNEPSVRCVAVQPEAPERETVQCSMSGGGRSQFSLLRDREAFRSARDDFASEGGKRREGRSVTAWNRSGGPTVGLLTQYVQLDDGRPALYFDDDALGGYGVVFGPPNGSQAGLLEFWSGVARPR